MLLPFPEESRGARGLRPPRRLLSHVDRFLFPRRPAPGGRRPPGILSFSPAPTANTLDGRAAFHLPSPGEPRDPAQRRPAKGRCGPVAAGFGDRRRPRTPLCPARI